MALRHPKGKIIANSRPVFQYFGRIGGHGGVDEGIDRAFAGQHGVFGHLGMFLWCRAVGDAAIERALGFDAFFFAEFQVAFDGFLHVFF